MTAEIINLRRVRKAKARADKAAAAGENRARHGRSKTERSRESSERAVAERHIEGHRREAADGGSPELPPQGRKP